MKNLKLYNDYVNEQFSLYSKSMRLFVPRRIKNTIDEILNNFDMNDLVYSRFNEDEVFVGYNTDNNTTLLPQGFEGEYYLSEWRNGRIIANHHISDSKYDRIQGALSNAIQMRGLPPDPLE